MCKDDKSTDLFGKDGNYVMILSFFNGIIDPYKYDKDFIEGKMYVLINQS